MFGSTCWSYVYPQLLSPVRLFATRWTAACQASLPITNSRSLLKLMSIESIRHPTIFSSVIPFSSCLQSFPASGSFPVSQFFVSGGQSIGASASVSVLPVNIQDWFPLGLTDLISLLSKTLSRVFSKTTVQKHPFFDTQLSLQYDYHSHTWLLERLTSQSLCIHRAGFSTKIIYSLFCDRDNDSYQISFLHFYTFQSFCSSRF